MTIYNVVDSDREWGATVYSFKEEEKAKEKFQEIINDYKENYKEFGEETRIEEYWADIVDKYSDEIALVEIKETNLK